MIKNKKLWLSFGIILSLAATTAVGEGDGDGDETEPTEDSYYDEKDATDSSGGAGGGGGAGSGTNEYDDPRYKDKISETTHVDKYWGSQAMVLSVADPNPHDIAGHVHIIDAHSFLLPNYHVDPADIPSDCAFYAFERVKRGTDRTSLDPDDYKFTGLETHPTSPGKKVMRMDSNTINNFNGFGIWCPDSKTHLAWHYWEDGLRLAKIGIPKIQRVNAETFVTKDGNGTLVDVPGLKASELEYRDANTFAFTGLDYTPTHEVVLKVSTEEGGLSRDALPIKFAIKTYSGSGPAGELVFNTGKDIRSVDYPYWKSIGFWNLTADVEIGHVAWTLGKYDRVPPPCTATGVLGTCMSESEAVVAGSISLVVIILVVLFIICICVYCCYKHKDRIGQAVRRLSRKSRGANSSSRPKSEPANKSTPAPADGGGAGPGGQA